jgi:hypothetical protein
VVLAVSGGGTGAAAFSYGVLEHLRKTVIVAPNGDKLRLLDAVDMSPLCAAIRVPQAKIYAVDVSFPALQDPAELACLNQ